MPAPNSGFMMFLFTLDIGRRSSLLPKRNPTAVTADWIAMFIMFALKFAVMVDSASPGCEIMSARDIWSAPVTSSYENVCPAAIPSVTVDSIKSCFPVSSPQGEVPATPELRIFA